MKTYDPDQSLFDFGGTLEETSISPLIVTTTGSSLSSSTMGAGLGSLDIDYLKQALADQKNAYKAYSPSPTQRLLEIKKQIEVAEKNIETLRKEESMILESARKEAEEILKYIERVSTPKSTPSVMEESAGRVIDDE